MSEARAQQVECDLLRVAGQSRAVDYLCGAGKRVW